MKKITISIPKNIKDKWKFSMTGGTNGKTRANVNTLFLTIEKRLLASEFKEKIAIVIKEGNITSNESYPSNNAQYLLYCLTCFLEDYLSKEVVKDKTKKYSWAADKY